MIIAHNIGNINHPNYNSREQIIETNEFISFDGVYFNVWENRDILVGKKNVILFVIGNYIGGNNKFDYSCPYERFADWNQIMDLVMMGCKLGWHTWSHLDLTKLSDDEITREVTPPFPMDYIAYPYGRFNDKVIKIVRQIGFKEGFSVIDGDNSDYQRIRSYLK